MPRKQTPGHCSCRHVSRSLRPHGKEISFPWWPALDHSSSSNTTICCVLRKQKGKETLCLREKQLRQEVQLFNEVHPNEFHLMRPLDTGSNQATLPLNSVEMDLQRNKWSAQIWNATFFLLFYWRMTALKYWFDICHTLSYICHTLAIGVHMNLPPTSHWNANFLTHLNYACITIIYIKHLYMYK